MQGCVFEGRGGWAGADDDVTCVQGGIQHLLFFEARGCGLRALLFDCGQGCGSSLDFGDEGAESGVGRVEGLSPRAGVEGFVEFVEGEEGECGSVECFDVGWVEAEGGGAVEGCGAIVFWARSE